MITELSVYTQQARSKNCRFVSLYALNISADSVCTTSAIELSYKEQTRHRRRLQSALCVTVAYGRFGAVYVCHGSKLLLVQQRTPVSPVSQKMEILRRQSVFSFFVQGHTFLVLVFDFRTRGPSTASS